MRLRAILYFLLGLLVIGGTVGLIRKSVAEKNTVKTVKDDRSARTQIRAARPARLAGTPETSAIANKQALAAYGKLPLSFEMNRGQTDEQATFVSRGSGHALFLNRQADLLLALPNTTARKSRLKNRHALVRAFVGLFLRDLKVFSRPHLFQNLRRD